MLTIANSGDYAPEKTGDLRKNVQDAFRGAVNRAIVKIEKFDKPLGQLLRRDKRAAPAVA